jgi:hypothetical protein
MLLHKLHILFGPLSHDLPCDLSTRQFGDFIHKGNATDQPFVLCNVLLDPRLDTLRSDMFAISFQHNIGARPFFTMSV